MEELNLGPPETKPSSGREENLNPGPPNYKASALTTRPCCSQKRRMRCQLTHPTLRQHEEVTERLHLYHLVSFLQDLFKCGVRKYNTEQHKVRIPTSILLAEQIEMPRLAKV